MPNLTQKTILAGYIPVVHQGYLEFFKAYPGAELYVFDDALLTTTDYLRKDLRALTPEQQIKSIQGLNLFKKMSLLSTKTIAEIDSEGNLIVLPDEDVSREVSKLFTKATVEFYPVFLRWDRQAIDTDATDTNKNVTSKPADQKIMKQAYILSQKSSDIWRHVGAVLLDKKGHQLAEAYNRSEPTEMTVLMDGDPRNALHRGEGIETSVMTHAEAFLVADAAKHGKALEGASLYVTTFPCPPCAKLIAHSGIKNCYYAEGYATLDGGRVLEAYGVKTIRVQGLGPTPVDKRRLKAYKKPKS